jgi:septation ring formation regulator EzrA
MAEITNELIYEILRQLQAGQAEVRAILADHTRQLLRVREEINNVRDDVNGLRGDDLRIETMQSNMDARLERIERRLNLSDA